MSERNETLVLQASDHNPRPDSLLLSEFENALRRERTCCRETFESLIRDKYVARKGVRFLLLGCGATPVVDEDPLPGVQQDVGCLMKERKPELVICLET